MADVQDPQKPQTPRERARIRTIAQIVQLGREHLALHGAAALSLRAVARDLGVVSSAVYRYVESRDELLTLLLIDAYGELGDAVDAAVEPFPADDFRGRFAALAHAVREWAMREPSRYSLLFGSPVPGYQAPAERTTGPGTRVVTRLMGILDSAYRAGRLAAPDAAVVPPRWLPTLKQSAVDWTWRSRTPCWPAARWCGRRSSGLSVSKSSGSTEPTRFPPPTNCFSTTWTCWPAWPDSTECPAPCCHLLRLSRLPVRPAGRGPILRRSDQAMTENSEPNSAGKTHASSRNPALEGDSGQYVEGDYGDAGVVGDDAAPIRKANIPPVIMATPGGAEVPAGAEEGEYAAGDYGQGGRWARNFPVSRRANTPKATMAPPVPRRSGARPTS